MKRLGRNETEVLRILAAGQGDRHLWSARKVCRAADPGSVLNVFSAERALEKLADRGLVEADQWSYGSGPRAFALTAAGENAAWRVLHNRLVAA